MEEYREEKAGIRTDRIAGRPEGQIQKKQELPEETLRRLEETERERSRYVRMQFYLSAVTAACSVMVLAILMAAYVTVVPDVQKTSEEIRTAAESLNRISSQLSEAELDQMVRNVDRMALTSEESVREALEKIQAIDIDELNRAIQGLSDVVQPFADFMNLFGR